jgi:hypothetical protein
MMTPIVRLFRALRSVVSAAASRFTCSSTYQVLRSIASLGLRGLVVKSLQSLRKPAGYDAGQLCFESRDSQEPASIIIHLIILFLPFYCPLTLTAFASTHAGRSGGSSRKRLGNLHSNNHDKRLSGEAPGAHSASMRAWQHLNGNLSTHNRCRRTK